MMQYNQSISCAAQREKLVIVKACGLPAAGDSHADDDDDTRCSSELGGTWLGNSSRASAAVQVANCGDEMCFSRRVFEIKSNSGQGGILPSRRRKCRAWTGLHDHFWKTCPRSHCAHAGISCTPQAPAASSPQSTAYSLKQGQTSGLRGAELSQLLGG